MQFQFSEEIKDSSLCGFAIHLDVELSRRGGGRKREKARGMLDLPSAARHANRRHFFSAWTVCVLMLKDDLLKPREKKGSDFVADISRARGSELC